MKIPFLSRAWTLLLAAVLPLTAFAASESPSLLLEKGIYAEEVERNLDSAIKIYEQIAAESAANRAVVAQAQYRLAGCYQKQGKKEQAIKLLNELVQQFPADTGMNKKARDTLVELGERASPAMTIRRVPVPAICDSILTISADGRYISYQPANSDDLGVCEIATGKTWTIFKGSNDKSPEGDAVISPDGQWIAYDVSGKAIFVAKLDGTETRQLYACDTKIAGAWTDAEGWSADSTQLIVGVWFKTEQDVALSLNVKTGASKEIARLPLPKVRPDSWTLSEDGSFIARRKGKYPRVITILDRKSGREETVVDHDAKGILGWAQGDTKLIYVQYRGAGVDLWAIRIIDGKPSGDPELLSSNSEDISSVGMTRDGNIYYEVKKRGAPDELWVMEGFLTQQKAIVANRLSATEISPNEIVGPDNSILDRKHGFSAMLPAGWSIKSAMRRSNGVTSLEFVVPDVSDASGAFNFMIPGRATGGVPPASDLAAFVDQTPKPTTTAETEAWLKRFSDFRTKAAQSNKSAKYQNRTESFASRMVGGHLALSWLADFTRGDKPWVEYMTYVYGENGGVGLPLQVPADKLDSIRPAWDGFIESVRLP